MKLRVLYHGHCFDGVASAATFTRFYQERIHPGSDVQYGGLLHRPGNLFDEAMFDGDENAIVDFKYSPSEKLTWWFDHHQSAFLTSEDEAHFRADHSGQKFLDASRKSCTEFIADVAETEFGFDAEPLRDLIHWAHVIDGALYDSAAQCVELKEPALQLMQVIEGEPDEKFIERIIRDLTQRPLAEVTTSAEVRRRFQPILELHRETLEAIRRKATYDKGVVQFDLVDEGWSGQVEHRIVACVREHEACEVAGTVVVPEIDLLRSQVGVSKRVARTGDHSVLLWEHKQHRRCTHLMGYDPVVRRRDDWRPDVFAHGSGVSSHRLVAADRIIDFWFGARLVKDQ